MTESEWLASVEPRRMLEFLAGNVSDRKLRLYYCACCRLVWHLLVTPQAKRTVEMAEGYADGEASDAVLSYAARAARRALRAAVLDARWFAESAAASVARPLSDINRPDIRILGATAIAGGESGMVQLVSEQAALLRDVFGNPFHPITVDSTWLRTEVVALALSVYDARSFGRLTELADALERAGCTDQEVLDHCRRPAEHVRGCWVVDFLLGRT